MKKSLGKGGLQFTDRERKEIRKKFQPVTLADEIAEYIQGVKFQPQSWDRFGDSKLRLGKEKSFNLTWIAKDGVRIDVIAKDFVMQSGHLELDEYAVISTIVELASSYPRGLTEYYYDRIQEQTKQDYTSDIELMEDDRISDEDWLAMQKIKTKRKSTATKTKRNYTPEFSVIKKLHDLNGKRTTAKVLNAIVDKCAALRTQKGVSHKPVLSAIYFMLGKALLRINKSKINTISKLELSKKLLDPIEKVISNPKIKQVTLGGSFDIEGLHFDFIPKENTSITGRTKDITKLSNIINQYLKHKVKNTSVHNTHTGFDVKINQDAIGKWFSKPMGEYKLRALSAIQDIVKVGIKVGEIKGNRPSIVKVHLFASVISVQKNTYPFLFQVRENQRGEYIYQTIFINEKKRPTKIIAGLTGFYCGIHKNYECYTDSVEPVKGTNIGKNQKLAQTYTDLPNKIKTADSAFSALLAKGRRKRFLGNTNIRKTAEKKRPTKKIAGLTGYYYGVYNKSCKRAINSVEPVKGTKVGKNQKSPKPFTDQPEKIKKSAAFSALLAPIAKEVKKQHLGSTNIQKSEILYQVHASACEHIADVYSDQEIKDLGIVENQGLGRANKKSVYQVVNDMLIKELEQSKLPWQKTWSSKYTFDDIGTFANFKSKSVYRGVNPWLIAMTMDKRHYDCPFFLSQKQIENAGGSLLPGAKKFMICYYGKAMVNDEIKKPDGKIESFERLIRFLKSYTVYNLADTDLQNWKETLNAPKTEPEKIKVCESVYENMPKRPELIHKGADAVYIPSLDQVRMPKLASFKSQPEYYTTLFHELVHSTGHAKRLKRDMSGRFGNSKYAYEELIAEIGASYVSAYCGIFFKTRKNSAAYLRGWCSKLATEAKENKTFLFKAASESQKAANFILSKQLAKNKKSKQKKSALGNADINTNSTHKPNPFNNLSDLQSGGIYQLKGDLGKLLGNLGVVETSITIKGDQGAGKSQLMWMMVNAFAELGKRVAVISPEMSAKSPTISNYRDKYVSTQNQQRVLFTDSKLTVQDLDKMADMYDVLFVDSFNNLEDYEQKQFKWLFQRQPNKAIIGLFQSTTSGEMRGGNRPEFDAYVNVEVRKVDDTFKNNYAVCTKNRFGGTGLKFNISKQKIQK